MNLTGQQPRPARRVQETLAIAPGQDTDTAAPQPIRAAAPAPSTTRTYAPQPGEAGTLSSASAQPPREAPGGAAPPGVDQKRLWRQASAGLDRIEIDPGVMKGAPVIRGTRVRVAQVLSALMEYGSIPEVVTQFSGQFTDEDVREALAFAANLAR